MLQHVSEILPGVLASAGIRLSKVMPYRQLLHAAWLDHIAPREPGAPSVLSAFSGTGGSSLGFSMAGYIERLAIEWDAHAVECFKLNFPGVPVFHGDIGTLSVEQALELASLQPGELDVLDGSPPSHGFAADGKVTPVAGTVDAFQKYLQLAPSGQFADSAKGMLASMDAKVDTAYKNPNAPPPAKKKK